MSNTIDKYLIFTFSIVNDLYPCHPYMFITEYCFRKSRFTTIICPAPKSPAEKSIPKKSLNTSLAKINNFLSGTVETWKNCKLFPLEMACFGSKISRKTENHSKLS